MPRVLFTHSNHLFSDRKQVEKMLPWPPLQTLLAAALLRHSGIAVELFDPTLEPGAVSPVPAFEAAIHRFGPDLIVVCEDDFNFLSKMCLIHNRELAFAIARAALRLGIPAVAHGSDASDHVNEYIAAGFSTVIVGEVETTLLEFVQGLSPGRIPGLAYSDCGMIRYTAPRPVRADLDSLPLPAWDLADIDSYRRAHTAAHGTFSLNMASSRGCPYRCNWCAKPIHGQNYHHRSPSSVAAEMRLLKDTYRPDRIWFADDIFALSPKWTIEFADAVESLDARIPFKMQSRCDLMTRDTVKALARAGCAEVWMGAESGSRKILDAMDKGIRVDQIFEARANLKRHGIRACFFLQFGYPGEEWPEIEATIEMVRRAAPDDIGVSVSYPLPGTVFHRKVSSQLTGISNWSDSADLAMVFRGTYSSDFYRALAHALHLEVRGGPAAFHQTQAAWQEVHRLEENDRLEKCALPAEAAAS